MNKLFAMCLVVFLMTIGSVHAGVLWVGIGGKNCQPYQDFALTNFNDIKPDPEHPCEFTENEKEGYFLVTCGKDGRVYIAAEKANACKAGVRAFNAILKK